MRAVQGFDIYHGASTLFDLVEAKHGKRRYELRGVVEYDVLFDTGTLHVRTEPGFIFDGRSGPAIIDFYAPNLGSLEERIGWHMHDCLGYAQSLDFWATNMALKLWLRDICAYRWPKPEVIRRAVSLSKSWYGVPSPDDWCACNIGKVTTKWQNAKEGVC